MEREIDLRGMAGKLFRRGKKDNDFDASYITDALKSKKDKDEKSMSKAEKLEEHYAEVFKKTGDLVRSYGETRFKGVTTGAGGRLVGCRRESVRYLKTPVAELRDGDDTVKVQISETHEGRSGYIVTRTGYKIRMQIDDETVSMYSLSRGHAKGWGGRNIDHESLNQVSDLLDAVEVYYEDNDIPKNALTRRKIELSQLSSEESSES